MEDRLGRIAYHAGAELNGYYYIVGGQDENLNTLNSIIVFDITQEIIKIDEKSGEHIVISGEGQKADILSNEKEDIAPDESGCAESDEARKPRG